MFQDLKSLVQIHVELEPYGFTFFNSWRNDFSGFPRRALKVRVDIINAIEVLGEEYP